MLQEGRFHLISKATDKGTVTSIWLVDFSVDLDELFA